MVNCRKPRPVYQSDGKDIHVDVCFDSTGEYIFTCANNDPDVRVLKGIDDVADVSHSIGEGAFAVCVTAESFFVACTDNVVWRHNRSTGEQEDIIAPRFDAEATCLAISHDGTLIVAGSADFRIRLLTMDVETLMTNDTKYFPGHQAPILSVALDPQGTFFASSGCDGALKIWNIVTNQCVKTIENVIPKVNDFLVSRMLARMDFTPKTGAILALPFGKEVKLLNRDKWEIVGTLASDDSNKAEVSIAVFSPDGSHLAAAYNNGKIIVYHMSSRKAVTTFPTSDGTRISGLKWNPVVAAISLVYANINGEINLLENAYSLTAAKTVEDASLHGKVKKTAPSDGLDSRQSAKASSSYATSVYEDGDLEADIDDDIMFVEKCLGDSPLVAKPELVIPSIKDTPRTLPQEAFQPGSTPYEQFSESFMVWNEIGYMKMYEDVKDAEYGESSTMRSIDVIFHNTLHHHTIHVMNAENYTLGTMNSRGYLLATEKPPKDDDDSVQIKSSKIHLSMVVGSDKSQWTMDLDAGEWVEGIAMGDEWCYVATSKRLLRVITFSGYQQYILDFPGPLISLAARQKLFMIAYHQSDPTFQGDQVIGFSIFRMEQRRVDLIVADQRLPLSPKAILTWFGFGARNTPTTADSSGMVRMYHYRNPLCKIWSPCLEIKPSTKNKKDRYFMFSVDEDAQQVRAFLCRNSRYPVTLPLPVTVFLPFTTLQAGITGEKSKLEAECTLYRVFPQQNDKFLRNCRTKIMRLFALYCQEGRDDRAADVALLLPTAKEMEGCWKYANRSGKSRLADELSRLITAITKDEEEDEEDNCLTARPISPVLFDENSQPSTSTATVDSSPLGRSVQAVKRAAVSKTSSHPLSASHTPRSLSKNIAGDIWESDEEEDNMTVRGKLPAPKVSLPPTNGTSRMTEKSSNEISLDEEDSDSGDGSGAPLSSHTMILADDTTNTASTPTATNIFKKKSDVVPPILRGISTMEDVTKSRTQAKPAGPSGCITPGIKRKAAASKSSSNGEPGVKRGRPKAGSKVSGDAADASPVTPKNTVNKATTSYSALEKFGFKKLEKKAELVEDMEVEDVQCIENERVTSPAAEIEELDLSP